MIRPKRDPAGHVPSVDFTLQGMLRFEFGAAFDNYRVQPSIQSVPRDISSIYGEPERLAFLRAAGESLVLCSLDASLMGVKPGRFAGEEPHALS